MMTFLHAYGDNCAAPARQGRILLALGIVGGLMTAPVQAALPARDASQTQPPPNTVTIPGTIQSRLGCPGDWQPDCPKTYLTYNPASDLWSGEFDLPAGAYEYKVALNGTWDENYGGRADRNGPNVPLKLDKPARVMFIYDHKSHIVVNNASGVIPIVVGSLQSELGCPTDDDPTCLVTFMSDPEFDGTYGFVTRKLPTGQYSARVSLFGVRGGTGAQRAVTFTITKATMETYIEFNAANGETAVSTDGAPKGNIAKTRAHWVSPDTIVWNVTGSPKFSYELHAAPAGGMTVGSKGIVGGEMIALSFTPTGAGEARSRFPHLASFTGLKLPPEAVARAPELLKGQLAVLMRDDKGNLLDSTGLQIPGVLDALYAERARAALAGAPLGVTWRAGAPALAVWAPTAVRVTLQLFEKGQAAPPTLVPMELDAGTGIWRVQGKPAWKNLFYRFQVEVFSRPAGAVVSNEATDPYSLNVSTNGRFSQIVDLTDAALQPANWSRTAKPPLAAPEDAVIYELHVRDFSIDDASVPTPLRGKFGAFTQTGSKGMTHLKALADAGLTHIHLLPAFDFATVEEDAAKRKEIDRAALARLPADSDKQTAAVEALGSSDGFNWGYDPHHFTVPEGGYATNPEGPARIVEFRDMVQALNASGLRVVMDVVYNHTNASGSGEKSVFDKIVPGYYHRLNSEGEVEKSTCCENTASEHAMMEQFMIDSLRVWARDYKVDGFRFDLMGHHMLSNMLAIRAALDALTVAKDGVDGKAIILYGEGWNFGEVQNGARGRNAIQQNLGGSGIASFNDRLRDALRGGTPFSDPRTTGFASGLFLDKQAGASVERNWLESSDWVRLGLAGNLRNYTLDTLTGPRRGEQILYGGSAAGYALDPGETINYASAHDNETLFDKIQWAAPEGVSMQQRVRLNTLALSVVMLGQGIPFFHAGDDILRSKSLDANSYNSSDWFNAIDWTYQRNGWGKGLPPSSKARWDDARPLLRNPALRPARADIVFSRDVFRELLRIRKSSALFRLRTSDEIQQRVRFWNTGPQQTPGLIVLDIDGAGAGDAYTRIVVAFNATGETVRLDVPALKGAALTLHSVQQQSVDRALAAAQFDPAGGTLSVPPLSTVVFVAQ